MKDAKAITMKNGKPATQGHASHAGPRCSELGRFKADTASIALDAEAG